MSDINYGRFIISGVIASIVVFVTDGFLHEAILGSDWKAVYDNLGAASPAHNSFQMIYFVIFELG